LQAARIGASMEKVFNTVVTEVGVFSSGLVILLAKQSKPDL
jgi:hypothetical protein